MFTYLDIIVVSIVSFGLFCTLTAIYALITNILARVIKIYKPLVMRIIQTILILSALGLSVLSINQHLYLATVGIYVLMLVSFGSRGEPGIFSMLFPVTLYLILFVDKYVIEGWRLGRGIRWFTTLHYQDS